MQWRTLTLSLSARIQVEGEERSTRRKDTILDEKEDQREEEEQKGRSMWGEEKERMLVRENEESKEKDTIN